MLKQLRQHLIQQLWQQHRATSSQIQLIEQALAKKQIHTLLLDHFAIIDLPGFHTGITTLQEIFTTLGYQEKGRDYLADKQNDFLWMAEEDSAHQLAKEALPQVVVADFRLDELPFEIKKIIECYASKASASPVSYMKKLIERIDSGNEEAQALLSQAFLLYFGGRDWPLPTIHEFHTVREFNELLSWVLVFGRKPNHFTLSIHLLDYFHNLADFHRFIEEETCLKLNQQGRTIKGDETVGIEQGSTIGSLQCVRLADGDVMIATDFVEFIWRYARNTSQEKALQWHDFFTGFIAQHADRVIESLYQKT